ncbi:MAG: hypothetical protein K6A38_07000 [Lachnospiraceae bacterium]|nr:hypothetical protein [Lachnospiraceae bacterium]
MAYKVSYKVVSEQGEQLKNTAKDMDNYIQSLNQIVSKLGNDELLNSVREDLKKFQKQLEEEKTILNLAGQILSEIVQSYSGAEKKSVQKVDKTKAHNRDFYKRPVAVASAGGGAATAAASGAGAAAASATSYSSTTINYNTVSPSSSSGEVGSAAASVASTIGAAVTSGPGKAAAIAAGAVAAVTGAGLAGAAVYDKKRSKAQEESESEISSEK